MLVIISWVPHPAALLDTRRVVWPGPDVVCHDVRSLSTLREPLYSHQLQGLVGCVSQLVSPALMLHFREGYREPPVARIETSGYIHTLSVREPLPTHSQRTISLSVRVGAASHALHGSEWWWWCIFSTTRSTFVCPVPCGVCALPMHAGRQAQVPCCPDGRPGRGIR